MGLSHISLSVLLSSLWIHVIVLLLFCSSFSSATKRNNETDHLALLQFKGKITNDPLGVMNSWNNTVHFCQWYGVTCGRGHQRVTMLVLRSLKLTGSISQHVGNLSFLRELNLENNSFNHEIPPKIGHLRRLQRLFLNNNSIGGEIPPNISSCSNLVVINFAYNKLVGKIHADIGSLLKLRYISLGHNILTGSIPFSFGNLSSLEILYMFENNVGGIIPDTMGQLKNLQVIDLRQNRFSSTIPPSIFNLSSLMILDVSGNHFHGVLPSDLGISLPNLLFLSIVYNQFTGSIPFSVSNATKLEVIQIGANKLNGRVPSLKKLRRLQWLSMTTNYLGSGGGNDLSFLSSLTNATTLEILAINDNYFGGMLPEHICNFSTRLRFLLLNSNQIYGSIPIGIVNLVNLQQFEAWNNHLSGIIPPKIGMLQNLQRLILSGNNFSGYIPSSVGNLTNLNIFRLGRNKLQGSIPSSLGNCRNLLGMDLSENNLSGAIPPQVIGLSSLSIALYLDQNLFNGSLPMEVGKLKNLRELSLFENMLSGEIPSSLGSCTSLEFLSMDVNFFHGPIPSSLSSLRGLQELNLSHNNLSGEIPKFFGGFNTLQSLNLSFNDFEGKVPTEGVFKNASATSVMGNKKLCGGIPEFHLPTCNLGKFNKRRLTHRLKSIIAILSVLLGVTLLLSFIVLFRFKKNRKKPTSGSSGPLLWRVSYQSLLKATDGFSSSNLIGTGSFGTVYKGILEQGRTIVAVKVLNLLHRGASRSFMAECEALRTIRHRNLVKVLTACSSVDYHGNDFKALVYDYMVNGTLENWLHPPIGIVEVDESSRNLNFLQRLNIAIDVACALEYLHHHCEAPIVHCDLKPSNVLLDDKMIAHVSDFGLAKFLSQSSHNAATNQSSSVGVRGTIGYAPPEYGLGSDVSSNGDVYSYGILLLEMFTGKRPTDDMFTNGLNLHNFAKTALPERVAEVTDPILLGEREEGETSTNRTRNQSHTRDHRIQETMILIFEIGVACSADSPRERINISEVAKNLLSVRNKLLGTRIRGERPSAHAVQSAGVQGRVLRALSKRLCKLISLQICSCLLCINDPLNF